MSIPFVDQSDYLRDMEELDDLMPASTGQLDSLTSPFDAEYDIVEEQAPEKKPSTLGRTPRSADDFIPQRFVDEVAKQTNPLELGRHAFPPTPPKRGSDDSWGDEPKADEPVDGKACLPSKTWFGSGGKAPQSEDDEKKGLLARIEAYRSTWPWLDEKITFPANLHKKSPEKLKAILEECSNRVQNRNMTSVLGIVFSTAICAAENLCTSQLGWTDLKGFALECENDETIKTSIKEIEIKYFASSKAMAPEARLAIALLQKLVAVTNRNRGQRLLADMARRSLDPRVAQEYQDL